MYNLIMNTEKIKKERKEYTNTNQIINMIHYYCN